jgi:hypothetical protein
LRQWCTQLGAAASKVGAPPAEGDQKRHPLLTPFAPPPPPFSAVVAVRAERDPTQRIVITGMGIASCFGNDPDKFSDK